MRVTPGTTAAPHGRAPQEGNVRYPLVPRRSRLRCCLPDDTGPGRHAVMLTLPRLERHLLGAAQILRGQVTGSHLMDCLLGMLILKCCSDQHGVSGNGTPPPEHEQQPGGAVHVPPAASWQHITSRIGAAAPARVLGGALTALEEANGLDGVMRQMGFTPDGGRFSRVNDTALRQLTAHFSRHRLRREDVAVPDLLGAAHEYLLAEFTGSAGRCGGEFYTPPAVAGMMTRILAPEPGMRVYDPCCGSGGLLIPAGEHAAGLALYGQERSGRAWALARMNMLLHGHPAADLRHDDTLTSPAHTGPGGTLARFDRILANPPFSMSYQRDGLQHEDRFGFGWAPETGKADWMFAQHVLAVLADDGLAAVILPQGALFRGGREQQIRRKIIEAGRLGAVISLPPGLFANTSMPACILILHGPAPRPASRRGKILFIDASREFTAGRRRNYLSPRHAEKITLACQDYASAPRFARLADAGEIAAGNFNLSVRRYIDSTPPPEPQDISAHLHGGVPEAETAAHAAAFAAYGIDVRGLFAPGRRSGYLSFPPGGWETAAARIPGLAAPAGKRISAAFEDWWARHATCLTRLPAAYPGPVEGTRRHLLETFTAAMSPLGILDRWQAAGALAEWWDEALPIIRGLTGIKGPAAAADWLSAVESVYGKASGTGGREARDPARSLRGACARGGGPPPSPAVAQCDRTPAPDTGTAEILVCAALKSGLEEHLDDAFTAGLRALAGRYRTWADKYAVSLREVQARQAEAAARLHQTLRELGYE